MSSFLPTKSSSRAGRFKKKLVTEDYLKSEAPVIEAKMAPFLELYKLKQISSAELTSIYVVMILSSRFPGTWLGAKKPTMGISHTLAFPLSSFTFEPNIQKRLEGVTTLGEVFNLFALKSTPETVNRALLSWSSGNYELELMFKIPTPQEVLHQQKYGRRVVTVLTEERRTRYFILGERDALSFTMHDLIHADHFYHNNECYKGQLGFYGLLDHCMRENHFADFNGHEKFEAEFEYLIADMNAYAIHLLKCLKSALVHFHSDGESFFKAWSKKISSSHEVNEALIFLNSEAFTCEHDKVLLQFLYQWNGITKQLD